MLPLRPRNLMRGSAIAAGLLVLLLCAGAARFSWQYMRATVWVNHTVEVMDQIRATRELLPGAGALSSGAFRVRRAAILEQFDRVQKLVQDNPRQVANARDFRAIFAGEGAGAAPAPIDSVQVAEADAILEQMVREEYRLLTDRIESQSAATRNGAVAACELCCALLLLGAITAVAARKESRRREEAERALVRDKDELTSYNTDLAIVSAGSELIQSARDESQIQNAIVQVMHDLIPDSRGYFAMISPSIDLVEICGTWGSPVDAVPFLPSECLALQMGRAIHRNNRLLRVVCEHARDCAGDYLCIPVRNAGGHLGVLHVQSDQTLSTRRLDVILLFATHIGLGLTNLRMREALKRETVRDGLTGLFNRRYFDETLRREAAAAGRHGRPVSVVMFDADHFKQLNDTWGHAAGDDALRQLAATVRSSFRAGDVLCRYGGEEFAVILPGASLDDAGLKAEAFRIAVEETELKSGGRSLGRMTISLGIASSSEIADPEDLVRAADAALYQAKRTGRNATWVCSDCPADLPAIPTSAVRLMEAASYEDALLPGALA